MKKLFLFLTLFIVSCSAFSQYVYQIKADSVRIHNDSCKAELILENSTKDVSGFLYNKGNGKTEFRKALVNLNNNTYLIGGDTLRLAQEVTTNNVFYVSKHYLGTAGAIVSGKTKESISSGNASYNAQLTKAIPGSMLYPYPDPFSARNAALDAITSGKILNAIVVILAGSSYTIGSDNPAQNGDLSYNVNSNVIADIAFSSANSTDVASLCQNNINYYFEQSTELHYVNSAYQIWMSYQYDSTDTKWQSGIYGHGYFKQYYGEKQGFNAGWCNIDNANASFSFNADYLELQYWVAFNLLNIGSFYIDVKKLQAGYIHILNTLLTRNGDGNELHGYFNCDNLIYGEGKTANQANDAWGHLVLAQVLRKQIVHYGLKI